MLYLFRLVSFVIRRLVILRVFIVLRNVVSFVFFLVGLEVGKFMVVSGFIIR